MNYTPKEFYLLKKADEQKRLDQLELEAVKALMMRKAYHSNKKNMTVLDFFDREKASMSEADRARAFAQKVEEAQQNQVWLNQIDFSSVKGGK